MVTESELTHPNKTLAYNRVWQSIWFGISLANEVANFVAAQRLGPSKNAATLQTLRESFMSLL